MKTVRQFLKTATVALLMMQVSIAADVADIKADAVLQRSANKDASMVILDVRTADEFAQGHVPGAINIPHDKLADRVGELMGAKNKDIVLYCRSGRRAGIAADTLKANGFAQLLHLEGDMIKWTEENRPVEK